MRGQAGPGQAVPGRERRDRPARVQRLVVRLVHRMPASNAAASAGDRVLLGPGEPVSADPIGVRHRPRRPGPRPGPVVPGRGRQLHQRQRRRWDGRPGAVRRPGPPRAGGTRQTGPLGAARARLYRRALVPGLQERVAFERLDRGADAASSASWPPAPGDARRPAHAAAPPRPRSPGPAGPPPGSPPTCSPPLGAPGPCSSDPANT